MKTGSNGIKAWPESERPREILLQKGPSSLSDAEVLAILLRGGTKGKDAISLARDLLRQFGSLRHLMMTTADELAKIPGIGPAKAAQILAAKVLSDRRYSEMIKSMDVLKNPESVYNYLAVSMRDLKEEIFKGIFLNKKNEILTVEDLGSGSPDRVKINPRLVIERCVTLGASKVILAHNHPSGGIVPSNQDIQLTVKVRDGLKFVDVELLDHVIIGRDGFHSMGSSGGLASI